METSSQSNCVKILENLVSGNFHNQTVDAYPTTLDEPLTYLFLLFSVQEHNWSKNMKQRKDRNVQKLTMMIMYYKSKSLLLYLKHIEYFQLYLQMYPTGINKHLYFFKLQLQNY